MTTSSPFATALIRGLYAAVVSGLIAFLTAWQQTDNTKAAIITGLLAGLSVLAMRGGLEGAYDSSRDATGSISKGDVGH